MEILTVTEITQYLSRLIESDDLLGRLSVKGEISNFSESLAGHCYFTLKDPQSQLKCVFFKGSRSRVKVQIKEGMKVVVRGRITVYGKMGQYQLVVDSLKEEGLGDLFEKYLKLKEKLQKEGLFDAAHKKPLPYLPRIVGVVTSPYGAAIRDIITTLRKRNNSVHIVLMPVIVQGAEAPESICDGLRKIQKVSGMEVIILGRGGGSFEELMAFSDERVAREIFACRIPVVSAVGHETDVSISDMVADVRAATPTAAAQIVVPASEELLHRLNTLKMRMHRAVAKLLQSCQWKLQSIEKRYIFRFPERQIQNLSQNLDLLHARLSRAYRTLFARRINQLDLLREKLEVYNPRTILEKGYCFAHRLPDNTLIRSREDVSAGDEIRLTLKDGELNARVQQ